MAIGALDAAAAYGRAIKNTAPTFGTSDDSSTSVGGAAGDGGTFGSMVESMVGDTANSLRNAETQSAKQVAGKGDLIDVVTAIGAAETALDTVVSVRDRVVNAYSEIMRMQI
ncbi:flagellar hook-basal body complex protein FliE [Novosphingobium sp. PhB165]|uniref:flagellar hook-basal body complex protein FliE n=1 Tax=Novosphingobium sp. PhB165 TaxID=2485105 RepID=UPI0010501729|nr:flagellar hook-basal body complex protein FliE [Novosphingobium sp. PhB165]TCM17731.1 flagellar hook-basal body complex protein FliE [Novosphingobium sp. PhB165]